MIGHSLGRMESSIKNVTLILFILGSSGILAGTVLILFILGSSGILAGTSAFDLIHAPMTLPPCTYGPITMHL